MGLASAWAPLPGGPLSPPFSTGALPQGGFPLWSDSHFTELKSLRFPDLEMKTTRLLGFC